MLRKLRSTLSLLTFRRYSFLPLFISFTTIVAFFLLNLSWDSRPFGRISRSYPEMVDIEDVNDEEINTEWNDPIPAELLKFVPKNIPNNLDYVMVPHADCAGFGDRNEFKTKGDLSSVMQVCDKNKEDYKSFIYKPNQNTLTTVYLKDSFGLPQVSSYNLYIKKKWLHPYLKILSVNLECAKCNVTIKDKHQCRIPVIDPWSKEILHLVPNLPPRTCNETKLYTELDGNELRLRDDKRNDSSFLYAMAEPITGGGRDNVYHAGKPRKLTLDNSTFIIDNDFWRVTTHLKNDIHHRTWHLSVVEKPEVLLRKSSSDAPLDVYIIIFDGTSHAHFRRMLPKSYSFLKDELKSFMFHGYSTVGDATLPNVNAMLTGNTLDESRLKVLDDWPLIFKDFKNSGYATMWSEDFADLGCFTLTLPGFQKPPTDHYARPLWESGAVGQCLGGQFQVKLQLDYLKSFMKSYKGRRKFGQLLMVDCCHRDLNLVSTADDEFLSFLTSLKKQHLLDHSMFMVMSDHGARFGEIRVTHQGKLEERLPFLSVTFPSWFFEKYPERVANFERNTKLITSPYDLHATFLHLLNFSKPTIMQSRGSSLFEVLPDHRVCADAGVTDQWCPCLEWHKVEPTHPHIKKSAVKIVSWMNNNLAKNELSKKLCKKIRLKRVLKAVGKVPTHSKKRGEKMDRCIYEIQFETIPGDAIFEVMVDIMNTGDYNVYEVSRLNAYGTHAQCIESKVPAVRKYCYCK